MGVMPEGITKGTILAKLDDRYANVSRTELEKRLDALRHLQPYPLERGRLVQYGVEVDIGWSDQQVTFIFRTPDVPYDDTPNPDDEPLFVVKRDKGAEDVVRVRVKTRWYP